MTNTQSNSTEAPKTTEQGKPANAPGPQQNQGGEQKPASQPQQK